MKRNLSTALLIAAAALCFHAAAGRHAVLRAVRLERLGPDAAPLADAPPAVAFTTAVLGGFRGLMADGLWLRASLLQDQGRYYELMPLSEWITALEPRNADIWTYHAWNLVYNVSAMMPDPDDRWRWIRNGIVLLRDDGLRLTGSDARLYWELGWIFQHRIGNMGRLQDTQDRLRWAGEMTPVMPGGRPGRDADLKAHGLDPARLRALDARLGPLDWRLPEPHALYWASLGRERVPPDATLEFDRMRFQCMATLVQTGRLHVDPDAGIYRAAPDLALLPRTLAVFQEALRTHDRSSVREAYESFLADTVLLLHDQGRPEDARRLFGLLQTDFPARAGKAFDDFVRQPRD